jgi:ubiquinone biosynthesis monooxygenase Coq7
MTTRPYSPIDRFIHGLDQALRTTLGPAPEPSRPNPAAAQAEAELTATERELAGRLMRINHAGEISAQALYQGQALTARLPTVRNKMEQAADEENDHLAWTAERIGELGTHTSVVAPLWYAGSFAIGALAGIAGDKWSLGFVAETEHQVVRHLDAHLARLPEQDAKSRAILEQMRTDEAQHATTAIAAGAAELPAPVKSMMALTSKIMTRTAYWV